MRKLLAALVLFWPALAFGAIGSIGTLGSAGSATPGTTIVITTSAALNTNNLALIRIGADNVGTTDAESSEVSSVADSVGNTYEKLCEYRYTDGGVAGQGAIISLWVGRAATQLSTSGTITITFAASTGARVAQAQELTVTAGNTLQVAGTCQTENINASDAGALVISGLPSKEYYFIRALAWESSAGAISILTTSYSSINPVSIDGGTEATSMTTAAERRILTGTGDTSNPTLSAVSHDGASIYVALEECTPKVSCGVVAAPKPRPPVIVQ